MREVSCVPSRPASGELLIENTIAIVGGSIGSAGIGAQLPEAATVSATGGGLEAGERHDFAGPGTLDRDSLQPACAQQLGEAGHLDHRAVRAEHRHGLVRLHLAGEHAAAHKPAEKGVGLKQADQHAERGISIRCRRRDVRDNTLEEWGHVGPGGGRVERGPAVTRRGVHERKVELLVGRSQSVEQIEDRLVHGLGPGIRSIHLADRNDGPQAEPERLVHDEFGLRHRALGCVHEDEHAVHHAEHPFDLAAEIRVAGGVDDVDAHTVPVDRGALGQDRDAAFSFELAAIHGALLHRLVRPHRAALAQQSVDQGRLAVIDMGNDGDVAQVHGCAVLLVKSADGTDARLVRLPNSHLIKGLW